MWIAVASEVPEMVCLDFSMKLFAISSISEVVSEQIVLFEASLGLTKKAIYIKFRFLGNHFQT